MIATQNSDPASMLNFKNEDIEESFDTMKSPINIVAHEQIISILSKDKKYWELATYLEYLQEIMKLPMDIATDSDGCSHKYHVWFFHEYLFHLNC